VAEWSIEEIPALRGYTIEWAEPGRFLLSRRNRIFASRDLRPPFEPVAGFPVPAWKRAASRLRLAQRLLRQLFYNVVPLPDGSLFVTYDRSVGVSRGSEVRELGGLARPCRVFRGGAGSDPAGNVYFGEYLPNVERSPIRIYRYVPGEDSVTQVLKFPQGGVQHVHGIYPDPFSDHLWCLTGDVKGECRFLRTRDGFASVETVGQGDETWRATSPIFTETHLYYAMDAELQRNRVFRLDRASGEREELGEVDGPVYFSVARGDDFFFAVAAELCPSQIGRHASLWHLTRDGGLRRLHAIEKDVWPIQLLPGTLHFPSGPGLEDRFHFHALALAGADNRVFEVRRR
jgi:hypothetical protein